MISSELSTKVRQNLPHHPTADQENAIQEWCRFLLSRESFALFVMRGYAGTGKSTLIGALVRTLEALRQSVVLLAPTGRAAKVMSLYAHAPAFTIHKRIYRQKNFADLDDFRIQPNLKPNTLFIVDEASMIANDGLSGSLFGSGRLLDDLIEFVYSCQGCRLMLVGDTAQLPPVGEEHSPALSSEYLASYGMQLFQTELTQVVRQQESSGILWNATQLRTVLSQNSDYPFPPFIRLSGFPDVVSLRGSELLEALEESYHRCGTDQTTVVTRSNSRAIRFNQGIRGRILGIEGELESGDILLVAKNNYFWIKDQKSMPFIANGDIAVVRRISHHRTLYDFRFADATLSFPDYDNVQADVILLLDALSSEAPSLTQEQQRSLFQQVWDDYPELTRKKDRMERVKNDPYYNALQIKYAYAVTCHKAQGGQWRHVYIDPGYLTAQTCDAQYYRWLYTAFTRATEKVFLINWPTPST